LAELQEKGGAVETVTTPYGSVVTFATLEGRKYYVSKKGQLWDTAVPPPALCNSCKLAHWFWECPEGASQY
jgi:hypothetical protein